MKRDWFLVAAALAGVVTATAGIVTTPTAAIPDDAVAVVNGRPIRRADYETALAAVVADGKVGSMDSALRRHVLERLIDEELLVQAALELGLAERDRRVRADLSSATLSFLKDAPSREPSEEELRAFFRDNAGYFARDVRLEVEQRFFGGRDASSRAGEARRVWLAGGDPGGDPPPLPLPRSPLPLPKLEQYLGPSAARAVADLPVGGVSEPTPSGDGYALLRVKSRRDGTAPRFEDAREEARVEWRRRATEAALRRFLSERRARAKLALRQELGS